MLYAVTPIFVKLHARVRLHVSVDFGCICRNALRFLVNSIPVPGGADLGSGRAKGNDNLLRLQHNMFQSSTFTPSLKYWRRTMRQDAVAVVPPGHIRTRHVTYQLFCFTVPTQSYLFIRGQQVPSHPHIPLPVSMRALKEEE